MNFFLATLGWAEYRAGHFPEADSGLIAAIENVGPSHEAAGQSSTFCLAMSLYRQGKPDEARKLAIETRAKMKPLPADEQNPLAGQADHNDLLVWLAYKEAKALIGFDPPPAAPLKPDGK